MRALELVAVDGPHAPGLTDAPETHADPDGIVVDVRAVGVHHPDLLLTKGASQLQPSVPFVPGSELAGGRLRGNGGFGGDAGLPRRGDVWAGGYAERVYVEMSAVFALPDEMDFRTH